MKNRIELADFFRDCGFTVGAEIGVWDGRYSEMLCKIIPNLKLSCIDPWEGYKGYRDHGVNSSFRRAYDTAKKVLKPYNCTIIRKYSMDAVKNFKDGELDFVFIDGNHEYSFVRDDVREWSKKVRRGGIVSGHDYYKTHHGNVGVINAVDEYVKEYGYKLNLTDWDNDNPNVDDRQPCWYFQV